MDALYPYFLIVHLICAIIFIGFIFTDVIILNAIKKYFDKETCDKIFSVISKRGVKIMPICLLLLVFTGGAMVSRYIGVEQGFFDTPLQKFLMLKIICALLIVLMVITSLTFSYIIKKKNPLAKIIHPVALILGFFIIVFAKLAFYA